MIEAKEKVRDSDILTRDEREGDRFLFLLSARRSEGGPFVLGDLRKLADRVEEFLTPRVGRLTLPYLRERPGINVGYAFVLWSPLESAERQILRLIEEAVACAELRNREKDRERREELVEIIFNRNIWTAFQPIVEIETRQIMGHEGLSRGPRGSLTRSTHGAVRPGGAGTASSRSSSAPAGGRRSRTGRSSAAPAGSSSTPFPPRSAIRASWAAACSTTSALA